MRKTTILGLIYILFVHYGCGDKASKPATNSDPEEKTVVSPPVKETTGTLQTDRGQLDVDTPGKKNRQHSSSSKSEGGKIERCEAEAKQYVGEYLEALKTSKVRDIDMTPFHKYAKSLNCIGEERFIQAGKEIVNSFFMNPENYQRGKGNQNYQDYRRIPNHEFDTIFLKKAFWDATRTD